MKKLLIIFIGLLPFLSSAQTHDYKFRKCFGYQKDSCKKSQNIYYKIQESSRSALFVKGQTSKMIIRIYNGRDYRLSLCWDLILGNRIGFKILDSETDNLLYDNSTDEFATEFEFTVTQTRDIVVEINVPGESGFSRNQENEDIILIRKDTEMGCVGLLVEHMLTPTKGF